MLKKFLGIFKRDKTGFSNEELEWQRKWICTIAYVSILFLVVIYCLIGSYKKSIELEIIMTLIVIFVVVFFNNKSTAGKFRKRRERKDFILYKKTKIF